MEENKDNTNNTSYTGKRVKPSRPDGKPLGFYCPLCGSPLSVRDEQLYGMCRTCAKEHYE